MHKKQLNVSEEINIIKPDFNLTIENFFDNL